jgi:hypothetical protein
MQRLTKRQRVRFGDAEGEWNIASTVDMTAADSTGPAIIPLDSGQSMVTKTESLLHSSWR